MAADAAAPEAFGVVSAALAIAGSVSGTVALAKSIAALRGTREFKAHMERERSHNSRSLKGVLLGCRKTILSMREMEGAEAYFRTLGTLSFMLQGALFRYDAYVEHSARRRVPELLTLLLDASAAERDASTRLLSTAYDHIGHLIGSIKTPPPDPRPGA